MYQAVRSDSLSHCRTGVSDRAWYPDLSIRQTKMNPWSYLWIGVGGTNAGKYIRDIGLNSEQLIFRSERGDELKKIVLDILKHTKMTTSNLYYLQGKLYDFFSVLAQDLVIDSYQGSSKENEYGGKKRICRIY